MKDIEKFILEYNRNRVASKFNTVLIWLVLGLLAILFFIYLDSTYEPKMDHELNKLQKIYSNNETTTNTIEVFTPCIEKTTSH